MVHLSAPQGQDEAEGREGGLGHAHAHAKVLLPAATVRGAQDSRASLETAAAGMIPGIDAEFPVKNRARTDFRWNPEKRQYMYEKKLIILISSSMICSF